MSKCKRINAATRSTTYETAVKNSELCYGNSNNIKACDIKYNKENIPHPVCLQEEYLASGGTKKGTEWNLINKSRKTETNGIMQKHIKNISKYLTRAFKWDLQIKIIIHQPIQCQKMNTKNNRTCSRFNNKC